MNTQIEDRLLTELPFKQSIRVYLKRLALLLIVGITYFLWGFIITVANPTGDLSGLLTGLLFGVFICIVLCTWDHYVRYSRFIFLRLRTDLILSYLYAVFNTLLLNLFWLQSYASTGRSILYEALIAAGISVLIGYLSGSLFTLLYREELIWAFLKPRSVDLIYYLGRIFSCIILYVVATTINPPMFSKIAWRNVANVVALVFIFSWKRFVCKPIEEARRAKRVEAVQTNKIVQNNSGIARI